MTKNSRFRPYTVIFYGTEKELFKILREYSARISHYAFILHDKDVYLDDIYEDDKVTLKHAKGDIEKPHYHVLVDFYDGHTFTAVKKMFTTENDNPRVESVRDRVAQFRYLTHKDDKDKYQYPDSAIISNDINYYEKLCLMGDKTDVDSKSIQIVEDILRGVSPAILMRRYGRDYIIHKRQYHECAVDIQMWETCHPEPSKNLEPIQMEMEMPF